MIRRTHRPDRQLWRIPGKHHRHFFLTPFYPCFSIILFSYRPYFLAFPEKCSNRSRGTSNAYSSIPPLYSCIAAFCSGLHLYRHPHLLSQNLRPFHRFRNPSFSSLCFPHNPPRRNPSPYRPRNAARPFTCLYFLRRIRTSHRSTGGCRVASVHVVPHVSWNLHLKMTSRTFPSNGVRVVL